ncbi:MAG: YjbQ family protein [Gammaproteobacteria bacterium]|nr:YjbQ family protein [Gammaproteobacteria bacterium]
MPANKAYLHNELHLRDCPPDEPKNVHALIMAMLISSSEPIPVIEGALAMGEWQSLIFAELDGPRARTLNVRLIGNTSSSH